MNYKTSFQLTKEYFSECFDQSIRYGNNWRKFEYIIGTVFLLAGACLLVYTKMSTLTPLVFVFIGIYELLNPPIKKIWWIKRQMSSKVADSSIDISISEEGIRSKSPFSESSMSWDSIEKIVETPKGLLIWPHKGLHIYLRKEPIPAEAINFIISKAPQS